jgi:hypothetical protein
MRRRIFSIVSVSPRWPCTWAQPVMPGLTLWRRDNGEIRSANASLRAIGCGRGPTIDISPSSTFTSWGRSSEYGQRASSRASSRRPGPQAYRKDLPFGGMLADLMAGRQHIFQSIRIWRQQLGRRDVRPREQGFDALSGWAPRVLTRTKISFGRMRCKSIPVGRVWVRFAKYNLLIENWIHATQAGALALRILLMRTHGYAANRPLTQPLYPGAMPLGDCFGPASPRSHVAVVYSVPISRRDCRQPPHAANP